VVAKLLREPMQPRDDWRQRFEAMGFYFHSIDGIYWDETACYRFSSEQIDMLEAVTQELHKMSLTIVEDVIQHNRFAELAIPAEFVPYVIESWRRGDPSLYGRFDLCYDGVNPPKLLEYNADTPTSLIESSVAQWDWQQQCRPHDDQFNSLHEKLIARWHQIIAKTQSDNIIYFACVKDQEEDLGNLDYLRDTALQAGIDARHIYIEDMGWDALSHQFVDLNGHPIKSLFKLYPWEWLMRENYAQQLLNAPLRMLEPPWKIILSNKGLLPLLWEKYKGHENLLPASFTPMMGDHVKKPLYSREGANISIQQGDISHTESGEYGAEGFIYQSFAPLPKFGEAFTVLGAWVIGDEPAGICLREDATLITKNTSRFLPHYFS
jgi:glutathionylspermidine synthase